MFRLLLFLLSLFIIPAHLLYSQELEPKLIQFFGVVVTEDSLKPVPFTHVLIKGTNRGTITDFNGFFSFVARPNDRIVFSSVGFKKSEYKIPDTLCTDHYTMFQLLYHDTILLSETVIYPWPSPSQFKKAFMSLNIPDDDLERARKNIELMVLREKMITVPMDGRMNYRHYMQNQMNTYYHLGQMPPNNLLNPFAWAEFFKAWQRGDFKRDKN